MQGELRQNESDARSWQFSLRTMFVLTAGVAVCFALQRVIGTAPIVMAAIVSALIGVISWVDAPLSPKRRQLIMRRMLWCFGLTMVLATACLPAPHLHGPSRRSACANNLRQLWLSVLQYDSQFGSFPPAYTPDAKGKPMHSWRVQILPYADGSARSRAYKWNEPWDGPTNRTLWSEPPGVFNCYSSSAKLADRTDYVAVTGPGTAWPGATGAKVNEIRDPAKCILLIELEQSNIHWMEPRDITVAEALMLYSKSSGRVSGHIGGANVVFVDGHVEFLDATQLIQHLQAMLPAAEVENTKP